MLVFKGTNIKHHILLVQYIRCIYSHCYNISDVGVLWSFSLWSNFQGGTKRHIKLVGT